MFKCMIDNRIFSALSNDIMKEMYTLKKRKKNFSIERDVMNIF